MKYDGIRKYLEEGYSFKDVWCPDRHIAFSLRDLYSDKFSQAKELAEKEGYDIKAKNVGGRAVIHDGGTISFSIIGEDTTGIKDRYNICLEILEEKFNDIGIEETYIGEPDGSFCPGENSLSAPSGKIIGLGQRVKKDYFLLSGVIIFNIDEKVLKTYSNLYTLYGLDFSPNSVGSIEDEGDFNLSNIIREMEDILPRLQDELS
jgi:lipoate-protein ligase A